MMAMQEECRMEMMKFYIQSQNPNLFEEMYHGVSYPDAMKPEDRRGPETQGQPSAPAPAANDQAQVVNEPEISKPSDEVSSNPQNISSPTSPVSSSASTSSSSTTPLKDLLVNNLNPDAYEFVPNKFSDLKISDDTKQDL